MVNMWKNYCEQGTDMPKNVIEALSVFFHEILMLIDKSIYFGILHFIDTGAIIDGCCLVDRVAVVMVISVSIVESRTTCLPFHSLLRSIFKFN